QFEVRLDVVHGALEDLEGVLLGLRLHLVEGLVHDLLRDRALAAVHHRVDELRHQRAVVEGVGIDLPLRHRSATWHLSLANLRSSDSFPKNKTGGAGSARPQPAAPRQRRLGSAAAPPRGSWSPGGTTDFGRPDFPELVSPATRPAIFLVVAPTIRP